MTEVEWESTPWPDRVDAARDVVGTIQELSDRLGVARETVYRWKRGDRTPCRSAAEIMKAICVQNCDLSIGYMSPLKLYPENVVPYDLSLSERANEMIRLSVLCIKLTSILRDLRKFPFIATIVNSYDAEPISAAVRLTLPGDPQFLALVVITKVQDYNKQYVARFQIRDGKKIMQAMVYVVTHGAFADIVRKLKAYMKHKYGISIDTRLTNLTIQKNNGQ